MKQKKWLLLIGLVTLALVVTACGGQQASQNQGGQSAQSEENNAQNNTEVFKMVSTSIAPPTGDLGMGYEDFLDEIERRSEGRIEIERYQSGSLVKGGDELEALNAGIADIGWFIPSYVPGKVPLATVGTNPGFWEDSWVGAKAYNELYNTVPEMKQELEEENGVKFIGQYALSSLYVFSTKEINGIDDLKDLKVVANGQVSLLAQELGAVPFSVPIEDLYESVTRGVVDGVFYGPVEISTYGLVDTMKYMYKLPVGSSAGLIAMNMDTWNSLPEDLQTMILDTAADYMPKKFHEIYQIQAGERSMKELEEAGTIFIEPTEEEVAYVKQVAREKVWPTWLERLDDQEVGQKVLDTLSELVDKYNEENPFK